MGIAWIVLGGVLSVGEGQQYATITEAAAAAGDGDTVEIHAGTYHEAVTWRANNLLVRGVGERPTIDLTGMTIGNGKAIFVSAGANATFENLAFVGASVIDQNGAGIRWEGTGMLTVQRCVFRSNENGILGGGQPDNIGVIENNEFVDNGRGDVGFTHSVYFNEADMIVFRGNWSHALWPDGTDIGHLFKSRAHHNVIEFNRITAEGSPSSYEINLPQGGQASIIGNLIQQRVGGQHTMISFGDGDGTQYPNSTLYVGNNTIVSEASNATFIRTTQADAQITVVNNLVVGAGTLVTGGVVTMNANLMTGAPGIVDAAGFDYDLVTGSPAVDVGAMPAPGEVPTEQYKHPAGTEPRQIVGGVIDVGAYEFGNPDDGGDGGDVGDGDADGGDTTDADGGGDTTSDGDDAGGCCGTSRSTDPLGAGLLVALVALGGLCARRRSPKAP